MHHCWSDHSTPSITMAEVEAPEKNLSLEAQALNQHTQDRSVNFKNTLSFRRRRGGWLPAVLIFGTELCERLATLGVGLNLITYLTNDLHLPASTSPNIVTNFLGTSYLCCLIGGFVADASLGRLKTIATCACIQLMGIGLLTMSASLPSLKPPPCTGAASCIPAKGKQMAFLYVALYLIALGTGGIKANVSAFGADQFDENDPKEKLEMAHFFNWLVVAISFGALFAVTVLVYIQDNVGRGWGYGISAVCMFVSILLLLAGIPLYRLKKAAGSPLTNIAHVLVAALRKKNVELPADEKLLYQKLHSPQRIDHTPQFRCLDKAAIADLEHDDLSKEISWRLCSVTKVEEVKMVIRVLPIWATSILGYTIFAQTTTLAVIQGSTMNRQLGKHFKFPPASTGAFLQLSVMLTVMAYDRFFLPAARKYTGRNEGITLLQRIGCGMFISILAMIVAAVVERKRQSVAIEHNLLNNPKATVPISIFWLVPQYLLVGLSEAFTYIGQLEFFYQQAPDGMRSMITGLFLSTISCGFFFSSFLISTVNRVTSSHGGHAWVSNNINKGRLDLFYWLLAVLSAVNALVYLISARWYRYRTPTDQSCKIETEISSSKLDQVH